VSVRQSRDNDAIEPPLEPNYGDIPLDAVGNPVFFILPPGVRSSYERKMERCEIGWRATGDAWLIAEAMTLAFLHRQVAPAWLDEAVCFLADNSRGREHAKRAREAQVRSMRYQAVRDAHRGGPSWEEAYERASEVLARTLAAASPETMHEHYKRVRRDLKEGHGGRYAVPKLRRRPVLGGVNRGRTAP
jgi:hypothetical protein